LEARLRPNPLRELTAHSLIKGERRAAEGRWKEGRRKGREGEEEGGENDIPL